VLGVLLRYPDAADEVTRHLRGADFSDPAHGEIFAVLARQHARGGVDVRLAAAELKERPEFAEGNAAGMMMELADGVATAAYVADEVEKIIEARRKRQYIDVAEQIQDAACNGHTADSVLSILRAEAWEAEQEQAAKPTDEFSFRDLRATYPNLRPPVIDGLARQGEVVNIISNSKAGKSWFLHLLLHDFIAGREFLGRFATTPGKVLLIDNELQRETLASRIATVADALGIPPEHYQDDLIVWTLRDNIPTWPELAKRMQRVDPDDYAIIAFDSKYRFAAPGTSENENVDETQIYNLVNRVGGNAVKIFIHHATKGSQSDKRVTDVGSGAGAQSRATDCHLVLREHAEPDTVVLEAALRSFPPVEPISLRWAFPLWHPAEDVDPTLLKLRPSATEARQRASDQQGINKIADALLHGGATARQLRAKTGFGKYRLDRLLDQMTAAGQLNVNETTLGATTIHEYTLRD
jgi:hypothetical protein